MKHPSLESIEQELLNNVKDHPPIKIGPAYIENPEFSATSLIRLLKRNKNKKVMMPYYKHLLAIYNETKPKNKKDET